MNSNTKNKSRSTAAAASSPKGGLQTEESKSSTTHALMTMPQDHHNVNPCSFDSATNTFTTRHFMIRYQEEEVELNDLCHFRLELDCS